MLLNKIVFLTALLLSSEALSQVYRCTGDNGQKVFSNLPCGPDAHQIPALDLTPTSGGTLGVQPGQRSLGHSAGGNAGRPLDKQLITTRYQDLRSIVNRLVGSDQPALRDRLRSEIQRNESRALRANLLHPDWNVINGRYDERLEQIQRQHLGDNVNLARAWIRLEAERDAALFLLAPGS
ncbi:DUF4124 domain-containing protein [Nitrincola iocasae]|uniref:DUF4124 domain-containing protein n=1 Tax=Nitrincola iocasae TaxID=2614693 RepID=A0A5J6LFC1_9GAMM|nr:DUF4124 domain-containing protein [Nitrincola iocasae]QEW06911.1 DUF4124 domain-containing protein [Nitrincola iocasae]